MLAVSTRPMNVSMPRRIQSPVLIPKALCSIESPLPGTSSTIAKAYGSRRRSSVGDGPGALEWKAIQIDYLDVRKWLAPRNRETKASTLDAYALRKVPNLKFGTYDQSRGGKNPRPMDQGRSRSADDLPLVAHLVVVVGSCHIPAWDTNKDGELAQTPKLAGRRVIVAPLQGLLSVLPSGLEGVLGSVGESPPGGEGS
jgi:hypothetical protein